MKYDEHEELLEIFYRNQVSQNYTFPKNKFIKAEIGKRKKEIQFPIQHILYFPRQIFELLICHINDIKNINLDFEEYKMNDFVLKYYSNYLYKDILKYRAETIKLWHLFNADKNWGDNKHISEAHQCIKRMLQKWEYGDNDFNQEIKYIKDNIDQFIEKKNEVFMKQIPFEINNTIVKQLPEEKKVEWIVNFIPEGKECMIKSRRLEAIGNLNVDQMNAEDIKKVFDIINTESETKLILKIIQKIQNPKKTTLKKQGTFEDNNMLGKNEKQLINSGKRSIKPKILNEGANTNANDSKERKKDKIVQNS